MNPELDAPKDIRNWLKRFAGLNPYGKTNWRVCLAQHRLATRGGVFHHLPTGEIEMFALGPGGRVESRPMPGHKITSGMMEIPAYQGDGWIMERWMPAHIWGAREWWNAQRGEDGSALLGPYPTEGDYWMICGPFPKMPELGDMEEAISRYECAQRNRPVNLENYVRMAIKQEQEDIAKRRHKLVEYLEERRKSDLLPVLRSGSLSAQRFRQQLQKDAGLSGHSAIL